MKFWFRLAILSSCIASAWAQPAAPEVKAPPPTAQSALNAVLFYQILLGELNTRQGSAGAGFSIMLDAARKTRDPALFQRAVDIALQARSGDAALQAAQTWKRELPQAIEPNRYILQILLALNRVEEAGQALSVSIHDLPADEQKAAIASVPRIFSPLQDKKQAADVVEKALARAMAQPATAASAWTSVGRMRRDAGQPDLAIEAALKARAFDASAPGPIILGMSLMNSANPALQAMLDEAMQGQVLPELRLGYARTLIALQLNTQAVQQLKLLNDRHPEFAEGWLIHGLLLQEIGQTTLAEQHLVRFVQLNAKNTEPEPEPQASQAEALMALAQIAQRQGQLERAGQWLAQMPANTDPLQLASRKADLLAQQGRMDEARLVLAQVKTTTPEQAKRKTLAQSQWMREHKQAAGAYTLVKAALDAQADDADLVSELAMVTEKLKRFDEMERLLRQLMKARPQDPQAFNALGYSLADRKIRLDEARTLIEQAVKLAPQDPYIQDSLGWVAFRQGQATQALQILQAAYQAKPDAEIAAHLGEVLWTMGQTQDAANIWREGLLLKADNETLQETLKRLNFKP
ncbi:MAG: tetratricopeptide repeat protein [Limnohabitans sp.]